MKKLTTLMMMLLFSLSTFSQATKETLISTSEKHLKKLLSNPQSYQRESIDFKVIKSKDVLKYDLSEIIYSLNEIIHKINYLDTVSIQKYMKDIKTFGGVYFFDAEYFHNPCKIDYRYDNNGVAMRVRDTNCYIQQWQKEKKLSEDKYYNLLSKKEDIENLIENSKDEIEWCIVVINFRARNKYNGLVKERCNFWFVGGSVTAVFEDFYNSDKVFTQTMSESIKDYLGWGKQLYFLRQYLSVLKLEELLYPR
jgi:predicted RND superfamily exporter protein